MSLVFTQGSISEIYNVEMKIFEIAYYDMTLNLDVRIKGNKNKNLDRKIVLKCLNL